jgi:hypothetical protein
VTVEFREIVEEPVKPTYQVYVHDWYVGKLYWDQVGPQYWFRANAERDLTARDLHAIYSRMVALTLDFGGNPGYRFPSEDSE